jgi:hypothetical protein
MTSQTLVALLSHTVKDMTRWIRPAADDKKDKDREEDMREKGLDPDSLQYRESDGMYSRAALPSSII